ncbi:M56 family metallopeptidase [Mucilaginibacter sp. UR6-11]|uniref:M56 family metallopeptidase n=1 Tax=Mucilaginibacter sp. UR6-11 TaxID=1435644 RepID=UPI001E2DDBEC|nr:M56 family metallopeptidase [Mucilaginibacter sp. UR6-11]MCC8425998.1 hypothetical protein [Mucilaginibacter sp. UR6-11]
MDFFVYLLQVSACTGIFFGFYYLILNRFTFFSINRWYLLATLILSFAIPLLTITVREEYVPIIQQSAYLTSTDVVSQAVVAKPVENMNWLIVLKCVYALTVVLLLARMLIILAAFFAGIKGKTTNRIGNIHILCGDRLNNGSFLNYIFLNDKELNDEQIKQIVEHEMLHIKRLHSVDRIIVKIAQIVLWFNPFIYLYARSVEDNHEFEVDSEIGRFTDKNKYASLLLHLSIAKQNMLYNGFSVIPLKKRITMLFNQPTKNMKKITYVLILPLVVISCLAFANLKTIRKPVGNLEPKDVFQAVSRHQQQVRQAPGIAIVSQKALISDIPTKQTKAVADTERKKLQLSIDNVSNGHNNRSTGEPEITLIDDTNKKVLKIVSAQQTPDIRIDDGAQAGIRIVSIKGDRFFTRTHIVDADGKKFDQIHFQLPGESGSANLGVDDKAAAFIDGEFYDEEALKNISPEKAATLKFAGSGDVKRGKMPVGNYAMPFSFKTK